MKYQDDSYYIERVLSGDVSVYGTLVAKHKNMVFSIVLKILNSREDAEEISQDTFLKAYQSLRSFEKKSKFSTWLYRIAYNTAISKTRKKKMEFVGLETSIVDNYSTDEITINVHTIEDIDQKALVEKALSTLNESDNLLVTLYYKGDNSIEDISEITGLSVSNVKVKLFRIRKKLYDEMNEMMKKHEMM
ncbi:MAG: sigma-70 family RNA polymerase sigma factor [Bacteroidetes bacterium]|nr:sigma-70 family RNA polymerase sigma factor [Bacteroidota bacterium]